MPRIRSYLKHLNFRFVFKTLACFKHDKTLLLVFKVKVKKVKISFSNCKFPKRSIRHSSISLYCACFHFIRVEMSDGQKFKQS